MSIQDVLKKLFLNQFNSDLSTTSIVGTLILTALIGTYIFVIYRAVCRKAFYSKSFAISLPVISMITASIIISIQSSVVISLGMVGALSIVRFRTAVKDQMNAEELMFADHSFDVLVTRNVTWNLHDPEKAYSHWTRVLAPGGLLLNFDANWYRYLWDEEAELGHKRDRENLAVSDVRDENAGTDVDAMEAIARKTPLSRQHRPQWDLRVLSRFGIQASADEAIWQRVWTKEERINNASTPMFLIEGRKAGLLES